MKLSELIRGAALEDRVEGDPEITCLTCDTRALRPGGLFAALAGAREDGRRYIPEALARGAAAVLSDRFPDEPGPWLVSRAPRRDYALLCRAWFGDPGKDMILTGITGTNGKTTSACLLQAVLEEVLSARVGLIGTNRNLAGDRILPARRTTPDAYELQSLLAEMRAAGCAYAVMEVSSHALAQDRTAGLRFSAGLFTNLTRDHLDYHGSMAAYARAKEALFRQCAGGAFNADDAMGRRLAETFPGLTYALDRPAALRGRALRLEPGQTGFLLESGGERLPVRVPIPGRFTAYNALGVLACCALLGLPPERAAAALGKVPPVKGRAEVVPVPAPFTVVIDYAHTPDALEKILTALRAGCPGRLLCLFGCGGDRDRGKRPVMGEVAAELADLVVLTSDNPRTEDPEEILDQIAAGFPAGSSDWIRLTDRREAIRTVLSLGRPGDTILLAGKGHETCQEIGGRRIPLDEREEIASFFAANAL